MAGELETKIQDSLYKWCFKKGHDYMTPNIFAYELWESDFLSVTASKYICEYEIKISHSDFVKEKNKQTKHDIFKLKDNTSKPNYLWYVCPEGIIVPTEVPRYAGLIHTRYGNIGKVIKKAPKLHSENIEKKILAKIIRSYRYKYWNQRLGTSTIHG